MYRFLVGCIHHISINRGLLLVGVVFGARFLGEVFLAFEILDCVFLTVGVSAWIFLMCEYFEESYLGLALSDIQLWESGLWI